MGDNNKKKQKEESGALHCKVKGCKHSPSKFSFCTEHFDQFKFGLINKNGEPCMDFEKKEAQYKIHKESKSA
ncbi:MAG: hypothetical protein M9962_14715 [Oligoflexia bacterium]|nr:hypothetical protein [Oligoflexia bacterium]